MERENLAVPKLKIPPSEGDVNVKVAWPALSVVPEPLVAPTLVAEAG
jgi:hypothetical protein